MLHWAPKCLVWFSQWTSTVLNNSNRLTLKMDTNCMSCEVGTKVIFKNKLKCTLVQALRLCSGRTAHRGSRGIALLFLDYGTRRGEGSASCPGRTLPPGKTRYPLYRRLTGPQDRSGQVPKISPHTRIRSPDRPARSQSLYWLRYPAHKVLFKTWMNMSFESSWKADIFQIHITCSWLPICGNFQLA